MRPFVKPTNPQRCGPPFLPGGPHKEEEAERLNHESGDLRAWSIIDLHGGAHGSHYDSFSMPRKTKSL